MTDRQTTGLPMPNRRDTLQAGAIGLMGLGLAELSAFQCRAYSTQPRARFVIFIYLTGAYRIWIASI